MSTALFGVITAIMSAVSLAATALIVPGTGTPDAQDKPMYMGNAVDRYVTPFVPGCTADTCDPTSAKYPASFFPLVIFPGWCEPGRCETWNTSVEQGVESLTGLVSTTEDPDGLVLFGYSQGGAVVSDTLRDLAANNPSLLEKVLEVVLIGNIYNPDGGLFTRLGFLPTIPFLDITFGPKTPVDMFGEQGKFSSIGFEYDPVMYAPLYWGNPLAMLNALAAFETVHGYYLTPNENGPTDPIAYGYEPDQIEAILDQDCNLSPHCRPDQYNNEYWMLPARSLPMYDLLMSVVPAPLKPLVQPFVNLLTPVTKVLVDLGYDWSGNPAQQRWLSILPFNPFTNWVEVGFDLVAAVQEGIQNAFGGATTTVVVPAEEPNVLAFSARSGETGGAEALTMQGEPDLDEQQPAAEQPEGQQPENQDGGDGGGAGQKGLGQENGATENGDAGEQDPKQEDQEDGEDTVGDATDPVGTDPDDDMTDGNKVTPNTQQSEGDEDAGDDKNEQDTTETDDAESAGADTPAAA